MSSAALLLALGLAVSTATATADPPATETAKDETPTLETLVVTGTMPGPGLWQVRKGDNTLWLLGTVNPLPRNMQWDSSDVDALVGEADEVLTPGGVDLSVGVGGRFKMMMLAPKAISAVKNADGKRLSDVLPADTYARWSELKRKYLAKDRKVERLRPVFASTVLYSNAITHSNLSRAPVWEHIASLAKRHKVPVIDTRYSVKLDIDRKKAKAALEAFNATAAADIACLSQTMDTLESDLEAMKRAANAWATGDIALLRELDLERLKPACESLQDVALDRIELPEMEQEAVDLWLSKAESALARNRSTVAVVGMRRLLSADGLLAKLHARGYQVIEPDAEFEEMESELDAMTTVSAQP